MGSGRYIFHNFHNVLPRIISLFFFNFRLHDIASIYFVFFFWPSLLIRRRSYLYYLAFEFSSLCYLPHSSAIIFLSSSMSSDMHKAETDTMMALFLQLTISYSSVPLSSLVVHVLFLCAFRNVYYRR